MQDANIGIPVNPKAEKYSKVVVLARLNSAPPKCCKPVNCSSSRASQFCVVGVPVRLPQIAGGIEPPAGSWEPAVHQHHDHVVHWWDSWFLEKIFAKICSVFDSLFKGNYSCNRSKAHWGLKRNHVWSEVPKINDHYTSYVIIPNIKVPSGPTNASNKAIGETPRG